MNADVADVVIIGAGISGLAAARTLVDNGLRPKVIDKGRGVGGRMATRRIGGARLDHGAQFFTTRSPEFTTLIEEAVSAGAVTEWCRGFGPEPDGYPRWRGTEGMTSLAKWMGRDLDIEVGRTIADLREVPARSYVLTAPVPQTLAVLSFSGLLPEPELAIALASVAYKPTIAVMLVLSAPPTGLPDHGGEQFVDDQYLAFITDNQVKGISDIPAVTIHLSNDHSSYLWESSDAEVVEAALTHAIDRVGLLGDAEIIDHQVQRWRYAGPVEVWPEPTVTFGSSPFVALAGEAFAGPKVEGAFRSGQAAAHAIMAAL